MSIKSSYETDWDNHKSILEARFVLHAVLQSLLERFSAHPLVLTVHCGAGYSAISDLLLV